MRTQKGKKSARGAARQGRTGGIRESEESMTRNRNSNPTPHASTPTERNRCPNPNRKEFAPLPPGPSQSATQRERARERRAVPAAALTLIGRSSRTPRAEQEGAGRNVWGERAQAEERVVRRRTGKGRRRRVGREAPEPGSGIRAAALGAWGREKKGGEECLRWRPPNGFIAGRIEQLPGGSEASAPRVPSGPVPHEHRTDPSSSLASLSCVRCAPDVTGWDDGSLLSLL